jgi:hypothetical protein
MGPNLDLSSQLSPIRKAKLYLTGLLKHPLTYTQPIELK